jgi:YVTN family beta-propeller protein
VGSGAQSGTIAYVATGAFDALPGTTITPVDLTADRALSPITVGSLPSAFAATSDGRRLLVTVQGENHLVVLDAGGGSVLGTVTTGLQPDAVAVGGPSDNTALVANLGDGTVTPVDLSTMTAGRPIPVGPGPTGLAVSRAAPKATVWVSVGSSLIPITLSTLTAGPAIAVGHVAQGVALGPGGTTAWVAGVDGTVTPVDLGTGRARRAIHVGGKPSAILIPPARP